MKTLTLLALLSITATGHAQPAARSLPADIDPQSMSRLPLVLKDSLDAEGKRIFEAINGTEGNTPRLGPPNTTMYSLSAAEPYDRLNQVLRNDNVIGRAFFELSTLVAAREFNQQYEWSGHAPAAERAGVDQKVIDAIKYERPVAGLPEKEATVIEFGRAMLRGDHQVPAELFAKMVELFGRRGTMEVAMVIGDYVMTAMVLNAADQHLPPGREPLLPVR